MGTVSQNGWPVGPPRRARQIGDRGAKVTVADGPAGDVLVHVLQQFDRRVEDIDLKSTRGEYDDWGYADRNVRGSDDISNHASATAVDVNATRHPLGRVGTFRAEQVAEIHRILDEVDHVVRWGGDYTGRRDEMHFEINAGYAAVKRVADRLNNLTQEDDMTKEDRALLNLLRRITTETQRRVTLMRAEVAAGMKVIAADKDVTPEQMQQMMKDAAKEAMPTAAELAAELEPLIREVVPDEQADLILAKLGEKLADPLAAEVS